MSLRKSLSKSFHPILSIASLVGVVTIPFIQPQAVEEARGLLQIGRAYERRNDINAKVTRHNTYRSFVKLASGSRLPLPKL